MSFVTGGSFPASLVPAQNRMALNTNYLSFDDATGGGTFAQQYLPELYEAEIERYGNRTIGGFLRMVGAEMPMTSDQVIWSEQNRLHVAYRKVDVSVPGGLADADIQIVLDLSATGAQAADGAVRVGQTVLVSDNATGLVVQKGLVQAVKSSAGTLQDTLEVKLYGTATNSLPTYWSCIMQLICIRF